MPNRLLHLLILAASLYASGAAIVMFAGNTAHAPQARVVPAAAPAALATTLMPTVTVHPDDEIPTLATVTVRPFDGEALPTRASDHPLAVVAHPLQTAAVHVSGGGFDMPYYSFGKSLRRVNKE